MFSDPNSLPSLTDPNLSITEITSGLSAPTTMAFIGTDDILVLQKDNGQVRRVIAGVLQPSAVLDVAVDNFSERGMLGIAVHPNFQRPHSSISITRKAAQAVIPPARR